MKYGLLGLEKRPDIMVTRLCVLVCGNLYHIVPTMLSPVTCYTAVNVFITCLPLDA